MCTLSTFVEVVPRVSLHWRVGLSSPFVTSIHAQGHNFRKIAAKVFKTYTKTMTCHTICCSEGFACPPDKDVCSSPIISTCNKQHLLFEIRPEESDVLRTVLPYPEEPFRKDALAKRTEIGLFHSPPHPLPAFLVLHPL